MTDGENSKNTPNGEKLEPHSDNDGEYTKCSPTPTEKSEKDLDLDVKILEHQIAAKQAELEGKKQKTHNKLPNEFEVAGPSQENDKVGDNLTKKEPNIVCECQPNVAGAAVPTVCSFHISSDMKLNNSSSNIPLTNGKSLDQSFEHSKPNNPLRILSSIPSLSSQNSNQLVNHDERNEPGIFKSCTNFSTPYFKNDNSRSELCENFSASFNVPKERMNEMSLQESKTLVVEKSIAFETKSLEFVNNFREKNTNKENQIEVYSEKITEVKKLIFTSKDGNISADAMSNFSEINETSLQKTETDMDTLLVEKELKTKSLEIANDVTEKHANIDHNHIKTYSEKIRGVKQFLFKPKDGKLSPSNKPCLRKPSLIPKLSRPNSKLLEKSDSDKKTTINRLIEKFSDKIVSSATVNKTIEESVSILPGISSKSEEKEISISQNHKNQNFKKDSHAEWLYANIFEMKRLVLSLSNRPTWKQQREYTDKLMETIDELKQIADEIEALKEEKQLKNISTQSIDLIEHQQYVKKDFGTETNKSKDNKVYIKFLQSKTKSEKKLKDETNGPLEDTPLKPEVNAEDLNSTASKVKEIDSLDGVFIPSWEPPLHMEEDEETSGLDITITFPDESEQIDSHLSVRLSDISADALRKLKRCPKDFTLRMDFVQGKVHFQTGKTPANNFSIGPDLKFVENSVDDKKSDIIDIKRSTECKFGSEVISVENFKDMSSFKSLKSTDSELFNVVSLPFAYRALPLNAVTKSCYAFKTENIISAFLARQFVKSMPQIPSLTNIFEDRVLDSINRSALSPLEKKRKARAMQKKSITSNTTLQ